MATRCFAGSTADIVTLENVPAQVAWNKRSRSTTEANRQLKLFLNGSITKGQSVNLEHRRQRRWLSRSSSNKGAPSSAVTAPTGSITGAISSRAKVSAPSRMSAPASAENGSRKR